MNYYLKINIKLYKINYVHTNCINLIFHIFNTLKGSFSIFLFLYQNIILISNLNIFDFLHLRFLHLCNLNNIFYLLLKNILFDNLCRYQNFHIHHINCHKVYIVFLLMLILYNIRYLMGILHNSFH